MATSQHDLQISMSYNEHNKQLEKYLEFTESLIAGCQDLQNVKGTDKLKKKCLSEIRFLTSLKKKSCDLQESQLKSSNLSHFAGIFHAAQCLPGVCCILHPFSAPDRPESLVVDVVASQGYAWVKVIARKGQALHLIWAGQGQFGERDLVKQAEDYLTCASLHPINFRIPQIHFAFYNHVTIPMAEALEKLGIVVWGQRVPVERDIQDKLFEISSLVDDSDIEDSHRENYEEEETFNELSNYDKEECLTSEIWTSDVLTSKTDSSEAKKMFEDKHANTNTTQHVCENIQVKHEHEKSDGRDDREYSSNMQFEDHNVSSRLSKHVKKLNQEDPSESENSTSELNHINTKCLLLHDVSGAASSSTSFIVKNDFASTILSAIPEFNLSLFTGSDEKSENEAMIHKVNLDITTLITLVSAVTHGGCNFVFKEPILSEQAAEEREHPVLPTLKKYLQDKELYACQTAIDDFQTILNTLGGPNEIQRAEKLMEQINIVPDQPSERTKNMPGTGKIKERSKIIFGTGDQLKAVTVTANSGFVRAAEHQGVSFAVYLHPSRALTEQKEKNATVISDKRC